MRYVTCDAELWSVHGQLQTYTDDTFIILHAKSEKELLIKLEEDGHSLLGFFASNGLVANAQKMDLLIFRPTRTKSQVSMEISLDGSKIRENKEARILGVKITNDLSWGAHITQVKKDVLYRLSKLICKGRHLGV